MFVKRPKRNETDDDVQKFQDDFLSSAEKPSVSVIRRRAESGCVVPDLAAGAVATGGSEVRAHSSSTLTSVPYPNVHSKSSPMEVVETAVMVHKVVERAVPKRDSPIVFDGPHGAFPQANRRAESSGVTNGRTQQEGRSSKRKSLFARQMEAAASKSPAGTRLSSVGRNSSQAMSNFDSTGVPSIISESEWSKISAENDDQLRSMSNEEILSEQQKLQELLGPQLCQFLKNRQAGIRTKQPSATEGSFSATMPTATLSPTQDGTTTYTDVTAERLSAAGACTLRDAASPSIEMSDVTSAAATAVIPVAAEAAAVDLPIKVDPGWLHMDCPEPEKLAWTRSVEPPPTAAADAGPSGLPKPTVARFDFAGRVVDPSADVPTHLGLHHHGSEPDRAGYTLDELFHLARSSNSGQRSLALRAFGGVLRNERSGALDGTLQSPPGGLLSVLLDAGLVLLLRSALDNEPVLAPAVAAFHALLVDDRGESELLRLSRTWSCLVPSYATTAAQPASASRHHSGRGDRSHDGDDDETKSRQSYGVVAELLEMNFLQRLRYILEVLRPQPDTVNRILEILVRVAQTSRQAAYDVYRCPRLVACVLTEFVPLAWDAATPPVLQLTVSGDVADAAGSSGVPAYGRPVPAALRLLRILAAASSSLAAGLQAAAFGSGGGDPQSGLFERLARLALLPNAAPAVGLPPAVADEVAVEALLVWRACARHGRGLDAVLDTYPLLLERLRLAANVADTVVNQVSAAVHSCCGSRNAGSEQYLAAIVSLLDAATGACFREWPSGVGQGSSTEAPAAESMGSRRSVRFAGVPPAGTSATSDDDCGVGWRPAAATASAWARALAGLLDPVELLLRRLVTEATGCGTVKQSAGMPCCDCAALHQRHALIATLNFFSTYLTVAACVPGHTVAEWQHLAGRLITDAVRPLLESSACAARWYRLMQMPPPDRCSHRCGDSLGNAAAVEGLDGERTSSKRERPARQRLLPRLLTTQPAEDISSKASEDKAGAALRLNAACSLAAVLRLARAASHAQRNLVVSVAALSLGSEPALAYASGTTRRLLAGHLTCETDYFARQELAVARHLCLLAAEYCRFCCSSAAQSLPTAGERHLLVYHRLSLALLPALRRAEHLAGIQLLGSVAFSHELLRIDAGSYRDIDRRLQAVSLDGRNQSSNDGSIIDAASATEVPQTAAAESAAARDDDDTIVTAAMAGLPSMRSYYLEAVSDEGDKSAYREAGGGCDDIVESGSDTDFVAGCAASEPFMPVDWPYMPIVRLYEASLVYAPGRLQQSSPEAGSVVRATLQWAWLLVHRRPDALAAISTAAQYARLACVFLLGDGDLFLERDVRQLLASLLRRLLLGSSGSGDCLERFDLRRPIAGLASFHDLYMLLLDQYEAASFGDHTFANYVVVPLTQRQDVCYRKAFWGDHAASARITTMRPQDLLLPIGAFLEPAEADVEVVLLYWRALLSGTVTRSRNAFLYMLAVHHVNRFIYALDSGDNSARLDLLRAIVGFRRQHSLLVRDVLYYKNISMPDGTLECYADLPPSRQKAVDAAS